MMEEKEKSTLLNIPSIAEVMNNKQTAKEKVETFYKDAWNRDWYFSGIIQKGIITACFFWSAWSLGSWLWRLF